MIKNGFIRDKEGRWHNMSTVCSLYISQASAYIGDECWAIRVTWNSDAYDTDLLDHFVTKEEAQKYLDSMVRGEYGRQ